ncbi:MAG: hypothetical protein WC994_09410 [Brumimicrobium sp.]
MKHIVAIIGSKIRKSGKKHTIGKHIFCWSVMGNGSFFDEKDVKEIG